MSDATRILDAVRKALLSEPRVHPTEGPIHLTFVNGDLTMEGEVDRIAGKKLALEVAARVPGVANIVERLRVRRRLPWAMAISATRCATRCWTRARWPPARSASWIRNA